MIQYVNTSFRSSFKELDCYYVKPITLEKVSHRQRCDGYIDIAM